MCLMLLANKLHPIFCRYDSFKIFLMLEAVHHPARQTGNRELNFFLFTNVSIEPIRNERSI